jgi:hypothetical protein
MPTVAEPLRINGFWKLVQTSGYPGLDQGPRLGVSAVAGLEAALRGYCQKVGLEGDPADTLVAVGLLYHDHQDQAHDLVQDQTGIEGALVHAILHRREPDYWNAKYWFRRVGDHPMYRRLAVRAAGLAESPAGQELARRLTLSGTLDASAFVDACESVARRPASDPEVQYLQRLQHAEFEELVAHLLGEG